MNSLLIIGYVWPEPNSSAAGARMMQLIELFTKARYQITFATTAGPSIHRENIEDLGVSVKSIELNNSSFDEFLEELNPDTVIFDRFMMEEQFGWRVNTICPNALRILDTEDLHFLRSYREKEYKNKNLNESIKDADITKREIASIFRCDLSLIISEIELDYLKREFQIPDAILYYLPFLLEPITEENQQLLPSFEERHNFISIGNFRHAPNVDAVLYLKEHIWPMIHKELPNAEMHIYGAYPSSRITQMHSPKTNFHIKGWANHAADVVKYARVSLAPLRFGAGLKGKLVEAMQTGTPSVTTPVGAEGMNGSLPWNGVIAIDAEEFAAAAIELYNSKERWKFAQSKGFDIVNSRFSKIGFTSDFTNQINLIRSTLKEHRRNNFTGAMLMHHRTRSTYFLSKYIEIKNRLENKTS
jgi:O-antigen biosynthesis protein